IITLMMYWTNIQVGNETITATLIAAFVLMMFSVTDALLPVSDAVEEIPTYLDSITRMEQLSYENRAINKDNTLTPSIENENITIDISGVSYKYNDETDWVFNVFSLEIHQGEKIAI